MIRLEFGPISEIPKAKALYEKQLQFYWEYYTALAYQRHKIADALKDSLRERSKPYEFSRWQRVVKYRYSLNPLSAIGSLKDPGGRFNVGEIDPARYPVFSALYIASDKGTALAELLGRSGGGLLSPEELALTNPESIAAISVSGSLDSVLDVRDPSNLVAFVNLIKGFRLSPTLRAKAHALGVELQLVATPEMLVTELQHPNWRNWPMNVDVPAPGQILGQIAADAQIEGILYDSALTRKTCLAIYHQNFRNSTAYVRLDDPAPPGVAQTRLDSSNCDRLV